MRVALNGLFLDSPSTGTGQYVRHLLAAAGQLADEQGIELVAVTPTVDRAPEGSILAHPWLPGNLGKVEFEHINFPRACAASRFDLAHVPHFGPPLFPTIPTVVTIHDLIPLVLPEYKGSALVTLYTRIAALSSRRAARIIADSENSRQDIIKLLHVPPERVKVIYLAADSRFRPDINPTELARVRQSYGLPLKFVLYLGGFDVRKNVRLFIEAFGALPKAGTSDWKLVVAGRLPESDTAFFPDPRVGAGTDVLFVGEVKEDDKPALYALASLFVFPSRYEGFGLPPLEAMACGTPVLCSRAGSLPEVVGAGGVLVEPTDLSGWTAALDRLLNDDSSRRELTEKALTQSKKFSWESTIEETFAIYRDVGRNLAG